MKYTAVMSEMDNPVYLHSCGGTSGFRHDPRESEAASALTCESCDEPGEWKPLYVESDKQEPGPREPRCPWCGSPRWVSVSLDGGYTRRAQCVPCGTIHKGIIGPGSMSPGFNDPEATHPDYRDKPEPAETVTVTLRPFAHLGSVERIRAEIGRTYELHALGVPIQITVTR